ncbi:amidohydrolase [Mesorhizobium sp. M7D.F.Ca.US.004.01.2.1]|nr:amidohydrolase [Mesorhizobium sp. M7D.F.Ca.US.004.01.2.1]
MASGSANPDTTDIDAGILDRMIEIRRHLHRNPELSNREANTQRYLRQMLVDQGIADIRDVAGFGLAVDIVGTGKPSNRKLAIRADIDALPIEEESGVEFASMNPGVMHACGHDAHASMAFAVAAHLHQSRDDFGGTVRLFFQPAEEDEPSGGKRVVEEGLLDDIDAAICVHVDPYTPTGKIAVSSGPYTLACDTFDVLVTGSAAHVRAILEAIATAHGASVQLDIHKGEPGVVNDVEMTELIVASAKACIGVDNVLNTPGWTIADDFGYYSEKCPSVYFRLGIRNEAVGSVFPLHHARFRVDEAALKVGAATLVSAATSFLSMHREN